MLTVQAGKRVAGGAAPLENCRGGDVIVGSNSTVSVEVNKLAGQKEVPHRGHLLRRWPYLMSQIDRHARTKHI